VSLEALQYPVKALLQSGVFEGKTTAKELAKLETPLSDKELCVAAAFLEEEIATPPSIAEANAESEEGAAAPAAAVVQQQQLSEEEQKKVDKDLLTAAANGDEEGVRDLLARRANPNGAKDVRKLVAVSLSEFC